MSPTAGLPYRSGDAMYCRACKAEQKLTQAMLAAVPRNTPLAQRTLACAHCGAQGLVRLDAAESHKNLTLR